MRLATFKTATSTRVGLVVDDKIRDVTDEAGCADMISLIQNFAETPNRLAELKSRATTLVSLNDVKLVQPIERPGKIICLAGNYSEHITESGYVAPASTDVITQQLFLKPSSALIGDGEEIVVGKNNVKVGWETELAVVIGKRGKNIPVETAFEHVFGYTIVNDVSERGLNSTIENRREREMDRFLDWLAGKWFDTFAPCGPWIVTKEEVDDPHNLDIKLTINGELRQHGNTRDMIFLIPEQVAYASSIMTLEPGDIISTGTPAGAGIGGASTSLQDGDKLVCQIEQIGTLKNTVRYIA